MILEKKAEKILAVLPALDPRQTPELYQALFNLATDGDSQVTATEIAGFAFKCPNAPKQLWDLLMELLKDDAKDGDGDAYNDIGVMYYRGFGVPQDYAEAVKYYQKGAKRGSRQAQENLGYCYYYGRSVTVDYKKAFHYFALGAFDGHLISLYKIGDMYANGYYVSQNDEEAFCIYTRCMETMTEEAAPNVAGPVFLRLGKAFLEGKGTEIDPKAALVCFQKAETYLYDMVSRGEDMYRGSLHDAIGGQEDAREMLLDVINEDPYLD